MAYSLEIEYFNCFILTGTDGNDNYHVEESRIKGGYNEDFVDYGVRAYITDPSYGEQIRPNAMIYSGIFNNKTGVNNTNDFSIGENITKAVDIQNGSIQKLFAEDTNLNIFQEEKVSAALIDKDAVYTAEGNAITSSTDKVIGQIIPYGGNYGIGKNPESFAYYAGRKYFVDKPKGAVLRLSRDGITEISNYGMRSYFRDTLTSIPSNERIIGIWDNYNKDYVLSLGSSIGKTIVFDESANGWTSFFDYLPEQGGSIASKYFTIKNGNIYEHYKATDNRYGVFYGANPAKSSVELIFNQNPSVSKSFHTINYEGTSDWQTSVITTDSSDKSKAISYYDPANQDLIISGFKKLDNKYTCNIINDSPAQADEIIFGSDMSGIKGFFAKLTIETKDTNTDYKELFAVSTNYNINSY